MKFIFSPALIISYKSYFCKASTSDGIIALKRIPQYDLSGMPEYLNYLELI